MIDLIALDPATATLIETLVMAATLITTSACALLLLPWTDAEIDEVDEAARGLARQLVPPARPATRTAS